MSGQPSKTIRQKCRHWLLRRLPTCEDLLPVISQQLDGKIKVRQWIVLNLHLFVCKWCVDYAKQLSFLRKAVRIEADQINYPDITDEHSLSSEAKDRMKRSLTD
jgi:hypothetical protein